VGAARADAVGAVSPDRYGESQPTSCRDPRCVRGWLGTDPDNDGHPIPCLACKPHLAVTKADITDFVERQPSARAQQAIDQSNSKES
jgi:hypothetical protein